MKTYQYGKGVEICPRTKPCGSFHAMGETHIEEERIFDVLEAGRLIATKETWKEAKGLVSEILANKTKPEPAKKPPLP
jgi:hypothetical protein